MSAGGLGAMSGASLRIMSGVCDSAVLLCLAPRPMAFSRHINSLLLESACEEMAHVKLASRMHSRGSERGRCDEEVRIIEKMCKNIDGN